MVQKEGNTKLVAWFSDLTNEDVAIGGGKGASLAEMYNNKFPVPPGFVITAQAYQLFIKNAGLEQTINNLLHSVDIEDSNELEAASKRIRNAIEQASMPERLKEEITEAYDILDIDKQELSKQYADRGSALDILKMSHEPPFVAVRSSATTEDLADASFAGQQDSYLNIKGIDKLLEIVKKAFSSLYTARAIYYREKKGFAHDKAYLAVVVQTMIHADKSGVMFSRNPLKNDPNIIIESVWGLGVGIVSGTIVPDHYAISPELEIIERKISEKKTAYARDSAGTTQYVTLTPERSKQEVLTGHEIKVLAQLAKRLEEHYKKPQDIEFAISDGEIYITQSRPITTEVKVSDEEIEGEVLLKGLPASPGVSSGKVRIIRDLSQLGTVRKGDVIVTKMTNPDMVVSMQKAAAIVTDEGGVTSHAAIVSREMGIPAVVGTSNATEVLVDNQEITVDGFTGRIIEGKGKEKKVEILPIVPTKTKIKAIVDLPQYAERAAECGAKSVGLVRLEGIIASIGKHPAWFIRNEKLDEYISEVYKGIKTIAQPFEEVWYRTSDVRSDEYDTLEGAPENNESNPMLGDHGIRFSLKNLDLLEAEFKAIKELADEYPNKKIGVMMPQIISLKELKEAKEVAATVHFPENVKLGIMIETPAAVQIINALCEEGIDFISFGTNDLTQYTLAIDRNNENVQHLYDELNPAVLNSIRYVIRRCRHYGIETSICGQAGSKPEMASFLVKYGIDSISVNADAARKVSETVAKLEEEYAGEKRVQKKAEPVNKAIPVKEEVNKEISREDPKIEIKENITQEKVNVIEDKIEELKQERKLETPAVMQSNTSEEKDERDSLHRAMAELEEERKRREAMPDEPARQELVIEEKEEKEDGLQLAMKELEEQERQRDQREANAEYENKRSIVESELNPHERELVQTQQNKAHNETPRVEERQEQTETRIEETINHLQNQTEEKIEKPIQENIIHNQTENKIEEIRHEQIQQTQEEPKEESNQDALLRAMAELEKQNEGREEREAAREKERQEKKQEQTQQEKIETKQEIVSHELIQQEPKEELQEIVNHEPVQQEQKYEAEQETTYDLNENKTDSKFEEPKEERKIWDIKREEKENEVQQFPSQIEEEKEEEPEKELKIWDIKKQEKEKEEQINNEIKEESTPHKDETEAILAALEEGEEELPPVKPKEEERNNMYASEYMPSVEKSRTSDIPSLNDAIPLESTGFSEPKEEHVIELGPEQEVKLEEEEKTLEPKFEEMPERVFEGAVEQEIEESEVREEAKKEILQQANPEGKEEPEKKKEKDEVLDIF